MSKTPRSHSVSERGATGARSTARGAEVTVEKLIPEGKALARLADGRVVILTGAIPGDRVRLEQTAESKGLVRADRFQLVVPSELRRPAPCAVAEQCGGCDWMLLSETEQRARKLAVLEEALARTGKLDISALRLALVTGRSSDAYRGRIRLQVEGGRIGFYWRGSHELVEPEHCVVSAPVINLALRRVRELARRRPGALVGFTSLELREASDGSVSVYLEQRERVLPEVSRAWLADLREQFVVASAAEQGAALQRFQLTPDVYMLSPPGGFTQVNWDVNQRLIERFVSATGERGVSTFLDAYAGSGNFSLPLFARGLAGLAVESHRGAIEAAREAARRQGFTSARFECADAAERALALSAEGQSFDVVLLDPPRAGVKHGLAALAGLARAWLVMCSCNPVTLARDLRELRGMGFEIASVEAYDMFPQTHHLETLVWLRAPAQRGGAR